MASRFVSTVVCVDDIWNKYGYTVSIANDGRVYSFGKHLNGAHGHKEADVFPPKRINSLTNIQSVSCFQGHTMCLDYDGNVFIFGSNEGGSLGIGKRQDKLKYSYKPRKLDLPPIKQVSCGSDFTAKAPEYESILKTSASKSRPAMPSFEQGDRVSGRVSLRASKSETNDQTSPRIIPAPIEDMSSVDDSYLPPPPMNEDGTFKDVTPKRPNGPPPVRPRIPRPVK